MVAHHEGVREANSAAWPVGGLRLRRLARRGAPEPVVPLDRMDQRLHLGVLLGHPRRRLLRQGDEGPDAGVQPLFDGALPGEGLVDAVAEAGVRPRVPPALLPAPLVLATGLQPAPLGLGARGERVHDALLGHQLRVRPARRGGRRSRPFGVGAGGGGNGVGFQGRRVGGLVALLVAPPRQGGVGVPVPWCWRLERRRGPRLSARPGRPRLVLLLPPLRPLLLWLSLLGPLRLPLRLSLLEPLRLLLLGLLLLRP